MEINSAASFLVETILIGLGFCVVTIVVIFINNMFAKYWKPVNWKWTGMFVDYQPLPSKKNTETTTKDK